MAGILTTRGHLASRPVLISAAALGLLLTGCSFPGVRPTPAPIYVTATPAPVQDTPTLDDTAVVALVPEPSDTPPTFPTLVPATNTPLPPPKSTLTASFTVTFTDSPQPKRSKTAAPKCSNATAAQGGFATMLAQDSGLQASLGCVAGAAAGITAATLTFENGSMLYASQLGDLGNKVIYVLYNNGTYQRFDDTWIENVDPATTGEIPPAGRNTPVRGFGKVWHNNPTVKNALGWATNTEAGTSGELQRFVGGELFYVASLQQTFIFISGTTSIWRTNPTPF